MGVVLQSLVQHGAQAQRLEVYHAGEATAILEHRQQVYREARARHPNRWSGEIRNWELPERVWLNPEKEQPDLNQAA